MPDVEPVPPQRPPGATSPGPHRWAAHLLAECGLPALTLPPHPHPAVPTFLPPGSPNGAERWAASGAMALTGHPDGPPRLPPVDLAAAADGAALAFGALADLVSAPVAGNGSAAESGPELDGAALLGERAALLGLTRRGAVTPGGSTRLLKAADGWVAIGLRRPDDLALVPALIERAVTDADDPWPELADWLHDTAAVTACDRAQLLGLPAATRIAGPTGTDRPWRLNDLTLPDNRAAPTRRSGPWSRRPLVIDFSTLWAGPLATSLLLAAGVDVIKVESPNRPDGSRSGPSRFHDLLNAGKLSVAVRLDDPLVRELIDRADLIVTSARPRALEPLGLVPAPGRSWLTITGYGWHGPRRNWVAYGDDAAVAAGLLSGPADDPVFCADAVADPLTGLHAAVAALAVLIDGRPRHLDLSLHQVAAHLEARLPDVLGLRTRPEGRPDEVDVLAPRARPSRGVAARLGADQDHPLVRGGTR